MLYFKQIAAALTLAVSAVSMNAGCLWIIGDATPSGWSTDDATALLSSETDNSVYTGTVYLVAGKDFKFMTVPDFGNSEYGAAPGAVIENGVVALASGSDDNGYDKLQVHESGNYLITVNTTDLTARIVRSAYQKTEITVCSLFIVGSAAPNGWDVMTGTPLYQNEEQPYVFMNGNLNLKSGSFKIARVLKGACSWDAKYWYFRDAADENKIALGQDGDLQWNITADGVYTVSVDVKADTISIKSGATLGVVTVDADVNETATEYYTLSGVRVDKPQKGIFIRKNGADVSKVVIR